MKNNKKILAIIPARGGSKGIKNKNIIDINGKPLIAYTIEAASKSKYIDDILVSTDSRDIASVAEHFGGWIPFLRDGQYAKDTSKTIDAIIYTLDELKKINKNYDVLVLLQPTSPLRDYQDIDRALEIYFEYGEKSVVGISECDESMLLMRRLEDGEMTKVVDQNSTVRRQDFKKIYKVNGAIYINKIVDMNKDTSFNDNEVPYLMEKSHSVDIDEMADVALVKYYLDN